MNILYIQQVSALPPVAGNTRSFEFARDWVQQGHRVSLLTACPLSMESREKKKGIAVYEREGVRIIDLNIPYSHHMNYAARLIAFIRFICSYRQILPFAKEADLILTYSPPLSTAWLGYALRRKLHKKWVLEVADVWPDVPIGMGIIRNPLLKALLKHFAQKLYSSADTLLCFSEGMQEQLSAYKIAPSTLHVIHNGVRLEDFSPKSRHAEGPLRILYAGTMGRANGLDQLLQAMHLLKQRKDVRIECTLLGEGNRKKMLQKLAQDLHLDNVSFHPAVKRSTLNYYFQQAHIGIVCFAPYPVLEANGASKWFDYLAAGMPVVCNYRGWQAQYLDTYACGLAVTGGDPGALADALAMLAQAPALRHEMGLRARLLAEQLFDRKLLSGKTLLILETVYTPN